jgi:hypothetical protein
MPERISRLNRTQRRPLTCDSIQAAFSLLCLGGADYRVSLGDSYDYLAFAHSCGIFSPNMRLYNIHRQKIEALVSLHREGTDLRRLVHFMLSIEWHNDRGP